jgi:diguanylate cyclase (GGDEF)-like protein
MPSARVPRLLLTIGCAIAVVVIVCAALAVAGIEPFDNQGPRDAILAALIVSLLTAAAVLADTARRGAGARAAARREAEAARAEAETAREQAAQHRERAEQAEQRERGARAAAEREERGAAEHRRGAALARAALERERQWARELRSQVVAMHQARGALAGHDDVRSLVLRVALDLTDAPKGLLLARKDADGDGRLDVIAAEGFDGDASHSEIAQRFAERVISRDVVIREDAPQPSDAPVDDEISTLIAIPMYMTDEFSGVVICAGRPGGFDECDDDVLLSLGDHAGTVLQNTELHGRLRSAFVATIRLLTEAIQAKDPFLRGHSEDVADYVDAVSRQLGIDDLEREQLSFASLLHDVGKIGISERILLKPGRLTPEERSVIELHPRIGFRLVEQVPGMESIAPVILHHHERWDGSGYPARLRGEDIPLAARVIGVADAFSAMTEQRPYRDRMSLEDACGELERCAGSQFDPRVVNLFTAEVREHPRSGGVGPLAAALSDGELEARRRDDEGVLGAGTAALTDSLTLLYSHRYFHEAAVAQAERAAAQERPFAVLLAELTALPEINRRDGYAGGDDALRSCARALSQLAVRHGAVACRVGGARLGMLVDGVDPVAAAALAEQLREAMPAASGVRTGAATWQPGDSGTLVVARARAALEQARTA